MLNSPYAPPRSQFNGDDPARSPLRWHGAAIFALIPGLVMLLTQAGMLLESKKHLTAVNWEPLLVMSPMVAICAISGAVIAESCIKWNKKTLLAAGVAIGFLWTLGFVLIGTVYLVLKHGTSPNLAGGASLFVQVGKVVLPFVLLACAVLRFHGRRRGLMK